MKQKEIQAVYDAFNELILSDCVFVPKEEIAIENEVDAILSMFKPHGDCLTIDGNVFKTLKPFLPVNGKITLTTAGGTDISFDFTPPQLYITKDRKTDEIKEVTMVFYSMENYLWNYVAWHKLQFANSHFFKRIKLSDLEQEANNHSRFSTRITSK